MTNDPADEIAEFLGTPARDSWLPVPPGADMTADWQRVQNRTRPLVGFPTVHAPPAGNRKVDSIGGRWKMAAVGAIVAMAGVFAVTHFSRTPNYGLSDTRLYITKAGQHGVVQLADGSHVTMGPATTLRVTMPAEHDRSLERNLEVDGQVLVTAAHQPLSPLTVRTATSITRVLGTTFLVREYATDTVARIAVADGRVAIGRGQHDDVATTVLHPGMAGFVRDSGITVASGIMIRSVIGWTSGELIFEKTPVRDVVADLARSYGVHIMLADTTLAKRPITWGVRTDRDRIDQVIRELATLLGAHVTQNHDTLTIVPGRKAPARMEQRPFYPRQESQYGK